MNLHCSIAMHVPSTMHGSEYFVSFSFQLFELDSTLVFIEYVPRHVRSAYI